MQMGKEINTKTTIAVSFHTITGTVTAVAISNSNTLANILNIFKHLTINHILLI